MPPHRISILGVGLLGGSIGLAAKSLISGCEIIGYGHRPATLAAALKMGAIDRACDNPCDAVADSDLVILCTPVGLFSQLIPQISSKLSNRTIVTDVGSTKRAIVDLTQKHLPLPHRFVGSHPMAGGEKRGVEFARADLFNAATCITTPVADTAPQILETVEQFWRTLGMRITRLTPDLHDRLISDISHLPHAVAAAIVAVQSPESLALTGRGFLDATRIAAGDGALWRDIFLDNRDNLATGLRRLGTELDHLLKLLESNDADAIKLWLDRAAATRIAMRRDEP
jgi:prephenate dehydrogenase